MRRSDSLSWLREWVGPCIKTRQASMWRHEIRIPTLYYPWLNKVIGISRISPWFLSDPINSTKAEFILTTQAFFHRFLACAFFVFRPHKLICTCEKSEMRMWQRDKKKTLAFECEFSSTVNFLTETGLKIIRSNSRNASSLWKTLISVETYLHSKWTLLDQIRVSGIIVI